MTPAAHLRLVESSSPPSNTVAATKDEQDEEIRMLSPAAIEVLAGDEQRKSTGQPIEPLIARVLNGHGEPCISEKVEFLATVGDVTFQHRDEKTDSAGHAVCEFTAGQGRYRIEVRVLSTGLTHAFTGSVVKPRRTRATTMPPPAADRGSVPPAAPAPPQAAPEQTVTMPPAASTMLPPAPTALRIDPRAEPESEPPAAPRVEHVFRADPPAAQRLPPVAPVAAAVAAVPLGRIALKKVAVAVPTAQARPIAAVPAAAPKPAAQPQAKPASETPRRIPGAPIISVTTVILALLLGGSVAAAGIAAYQKLTAPAPAPVTAPAVHIDCSQATGARMEGNTLILQNCTDRARR